MKKILLLALTLLISSCVKKEQASLKILNQASQPITNFDPQLTTGLAASLQIGKIYEALYETHPFDGPYKVLPNLAKEMPQVSNNGKTYIINIKKNIKYHLSPDIESSQTVVAEDFITSFKRIADPRLQSPHYNYWKKQITGLQLFYEKNKKLEITDYRIPIQGLRAIGKYQLQINLKGPNIYFINDLASTVISPIPYNALKKINNDLSLKTFGTGPFILSKYVRKSRIVFLKNINYRDKFFPNIENRKYLKYLNHGQNKKVPFIDKIIVHIMNEQQTQWLNFMKGKVDYLEIPKDNFSKVITPQQELSSEMRNKGIRLGITSSKTNIYYLGFNNKSGPTKNKLIRKAISLLIDKAKYNQLFFNGTADIAHTILPPYLPGNNPPIQSPFYKRDLQKAKKLLEKAGHKNGAGLPEIIITVRNTSLARQIGEFFVKNLNDENIKAKVETVSWGRLLEKAQNGDYMVFYLAWFVGIPNGFQFYNLLYGQNWPDSYNRMGFQNKSFDSLYDKAFASSNLKKQNNYFRKMNLITLAEMPILPLIHAKDFFIHHGWLNNYIPSETASGVEQYYDIDLSLKKKLLLKY